MLFWYVHFLGLISTCMAWVTSFKLKSNGKDSPFESLTAVWFNIAWTELLFNLLKPFLIRIKTPHVRHISLDAFNPISVLVWMGQSTKVLVQHWPGSSPDDPPFWKTSRRRSWRRGWWSWRDELVGDETNRPIFTTKWSGKSMRRTRYTTRQTGITTRRLEMPI